MFKPPHSTKAQDSMVVPLRHLSELRTLAKETSHPRSLSGDELLELC